MWDSQYQITGNKTIPFIIKKDFDGISLKYPFSEEILHKYGNIRALKNNSGLQG